MKMQKPYNIPVSRPQITTEDVASVKECLEADGIREGPIVKILKMNLQKNSQKSMHLCSSGTVLLT